MNQTTYLWHLIPLRLWIGYYMANQGARKFERDFPHGDWIKRQIRELDQIDIYPWYKSFLMDIVVTNRELFGNLVMWGEILVGTCLILGLLSRYSAIIGLFMLANYYFGPGMARGAATPSVVAQQFTFMASMVVFMLSSPGRVLGLDALWSRKKLPPGKD